MSYFNKFQQIKYSIENRTYDLLNIFSRVSILGDYSSSTVFDKYIIQEGETPDDVSGLVYGDESLSWLVLLANNICSDDEWYGGDAKFETILNQKYSGESFYITNLPDLKQGDVMVKATAVDETSGTVTTIDETTYRSVVQFDKNFRSVWGRGGSGSFSANDKILFGRKNTQTGAVDIISFKSSSDVSKTVQYAEIKFVESKISSPIYLKQYTSDVVVPQNIVFENNEIQENYIPLNTLYTNPTDTNPNFANTILYYYMTNSGVVPGIRKYTNFMQEQDKYTTSQTISVIKSTYAPYIVTQIQQLIKSSDNIGKRIVIRL